jgi:putative hydrolase of the HAD superfamily
VKAVLLDVGGVMVAPNPDVLRERLDVDVTDEEAVRAHYVGVAAIDGAGPGEWAAYQAAVCVELGVPPSRLRSAVARLAEAFTWPSSGLWNHVLPTAMAGLRALAATEVPVAIVSNSDGNVEAILRDQRLCQVGEGDGVCVAVIVDSHHVGAEKPDPRVFTPALDTLGVDPADALYVGDMVWADVVGARAAGMRPVHMDPYDFCGAADHDHVRSLSEVANLL